jgi:hypothetical protein
LRGFEETHCYFQTVKALTTKDTKGHEGNAGRQNRVVLAQARTHLDLKSKWIRVCAGMTMWFSFASFASRLLIFLRAPSCPSWSAAVDLQATPFFLNHSIARFQPSSACAFL